MMRRVLGALLAAACCFAPAVSASAAKALAPGPFYQPPPALALSAPGAILRSQPLVAGVPAGARGWKILYASTDFQSGRPVAVSAVVFAPAARASNVPVVAWAHPTTGIDTPCAPSLLPDAGAARIPGLAALVARGYIVVGTDYPGLGTPGQHPYLVGTSEARAVLDSVRAVRNLDIGAGTRYAVYGHSQGGGAALWTSVIAATYAPELQSVGTIAIAPASLLAQILDADLRTRAGKILGAMATVAWSRIYPGASLRAVYATPAAVRVATRLSNLCVTTATHDTELAALVSATELTLSGGLRSGALAAAPWDGIVAQNTVAAARVRGPVLLVQGTADTIVPPAVTGAFRSAMCAAGAVVQYDTMNGVGHIGAGMQAVPLVLPWFEERFSGMRAPSNCQAAS